MHALYTTLKFINYPFFITFLWIQCTNNSKLHPSTVFFGLFFFFSFCLPNLEDCEPAVWRHLISCVCLLLCWATKDYIHYKLFVVFKRDVNCPACWTCMVFFLCLKMSFCRMTPAWHSYFIYGLITFLGQQQKSDRTSHPL